VLFVLAVLLCMFAGFDSCVGMKDFGRLCVGSLCELRPPLCCECRVVFIALGFVSMRQKIWLRIGMN